MRLGLRFGKSIWIVGDNANNGRKIQSDIAADPINKMPYNYDSFSYAQVAESANTSGERLKDTAAKIAQHRIALENYAKAANMYKKAVEIDRNILTPI